MAHERSDRHDPCYILRGKNIPCVLWCEDALKHYGVPTGLFRIHILVPDIDEAATALVRQGWHLEDNEQTTFGNFALHDAHRRLKPPVYASQSELAAWSPGARPPPLPEGRTSVVLLPVSKWGYTFQSNFDFNESLFPQLSKLLDGLIEKLLNLEPLADSIWHHIAVLIGYLYLYVPCVREKAFAADLRYEHRQYHYDSLSGMFTGTIPFLQHERKIRDALRAGTFQLRDCSADRSNELLFNDRVQAKLMALTPSPYTAEEYEADRQRELEEELAWWALQEE